MVRSEFCQQVLDMGALEVIIRLLKAHMANPVSYGKVVDDVVVDVVVDVVNGVDVVKQNSF